MPEVKKAGTFLPEILAPGTGLSPLTERSIMPANNVVTIQDILNGKKYTIPSGGGSWSAGWGKDTDQSFKEEADDYKRKEIDLEFINKIQNLNPNQHEEWKLKLPGATKYFSSLESLLQYKKQLGDNGTQIKWFTRVKTAQNNYKETVLSNSLSSTFMIESINFGDNVLENGSCFCISENIFTTCAHVIKKYNKNTEREADLNNIKQNIKTYIIKDNEKIPAEVIAMDLINDIALLYCNFKCDPLVLDENITIGENIFTIGSPYGFENNVSFGKIGSLNRKIYKHDDAPEYMFLDMSVYSGNSGGPVIKLLDGHVVGIVTAIVSHNSEYGLNAALYSKYLISFCRENNIKI